MTSLARTTRRLDGHTALLATAGDDAYTRMTLPLLSAHEPVGYVTDGAVGWFTELPWLSSFCVRGTPAAAVRLLKQVFRAGLVEVGTFVRLPRVAPGTLSPIPARHEQDWRFLSTDHPPPTQPSEDDVVELPPEAAGEVADLLTTGNPDSAANPTAPGIRRWFGVYRDGLLVACGADRSFNGVGYLARITVHPTQRGQGLGAALTSAMTRALHSEFGPVALGVTVDNDPASRLYRRLGYETAADLSTYELLC